MYSGVQKSENTFPFVNRKLVFLIPLYMVFTGQEFSIYLMI